MSECPHLTVVTKTVAKCRVLEEHGLEYIPGPSRSGHPCETCQAQWENGEPPTKEKMTIPMVKLLAYGKKMPLPTILEQMKLAGTAAVKFVAGGLPLVSTEEYQARIETCKGCSEYNEASGRCHACGCFIHEKATMLTEDCPAKKWPQIKREAVPVEMGTASFGCGGCGKR